MSRSIVIPLSMLVLSLSHCGEPSQTLDEPSAELELRTLRTPPGLIDHGTIPLGSSVETELSRQQSLHRWQFSLPASAEVSLATEASVASQPNDRALDTVLILQRIRPDGTRRWWAQNDDSDGSRFARLLRTLPQGDYEVTVHGFSAHVHGRFAFVTRCSGEGCPVPEPDCWLGSVFADLRSHPTLAISSETWITIPTQLPTDGERAQLVVAVQQSSHVDVTTPEEAIARVDQQEIRRMELHDDDGSVYLAFEYGVGDNSYGAIFAAGSTSVLASIHDGDLLRCAPHPHASEGRTGK